ncbi:hypothetical protein [Nonomuraea endophytica]|uniref:WD40 repeat domain-containing protein n=1 Tax=Nonomuraea endophytica TaxID=714136 RepID=A0A7W8AFG2_9ACTN|nr:hypothetical protein [Nonomuraea endophytica]MBB5085153.1 hypothetical protein [Nonomuraea endophytica]
MLMIMATACSANGPETAPTLPPVVLAVSSTGVLLYDPNTEVFSGYARDGRRLWTESRTGVEVRCAVQCPDAVFSGARGSYVAPFSRVGGKVENVSVSAADRQRVVSLRSDSDAVIVENSGKGDRLVVSRTDGSIKKHPIASAEDAVWVENPERSVALLLFADPELAGATMLRLTRDAGGWRAADSRWPANGYWGGCMGAQGGPAFLTGGKGAVLSESGPIPLRSDLPQVGECVAGKNGGALISRWMDGRGKPHTSVRGVDALGRQTWSRDLQAEAGVTADPTSATIAVVSHGRLELLDRNGKVSGQRDDVTAARFTETGQLVTVNRKNEVNWSAP